MFKIKGKTSGKHLLTSITGLFNEITSFLIGFHLYLLEFFQENCIEEKSTFDAIRSKCNANWNSLPKDKRENYKSDSDIIGHDVIDQKLDEIFEGFVAVQNKENKKKAEIARKIKYYLEDSFYLFDWNSQVFIFAHVNYQVKVKDNFYPIEIGLVKYSLDEGLIEEMHFHLNSGQLPIGNELHARVRSEDTHQLPVNTSFGKSFEEAKMELNKFMDNEKPFIFTLNEKDDIAAVKYTFDKIIDEVVYMVPLENLLSKYYEALHEKEYYIENARDDLTNKNPWESYDIGCKYHGELAASKYCSLAK